MPPSEDPGFPVQCARFSGRIFLPSSTATSKAARAALAEWQQHLQAAGHPPEDALVLACLAATGRLPLWLEGDGHTPTWAAPDPNERVQTCCRGPYPIAADLLGLQQVLQGGASIAQLRFKGPAELQRGAVEGAISLAREFPDSLVVINDHWQLAIELGAEAIHLGQEDLGNADLDAIHRAGLLLGVSTHSPIEVCRALWAGASMVAVGPIFPTFAKAMPWRPQGLHNLRFWRRHLHLPLVAIGGLGLEHCKAVVEAGADAMGVIGAIANTPDPQGATEAFAAEWRRSVESSLPNTTLLDAH